MEARALFVHKQLIRHRAMFPSYSGAARLTYIIHFCPL